MKQKLKEVIYQHPRMVGGIIKVVNHVPFNNKIRIKQGNNIRNFALLKQCTVLVKGKNNEIVIEDYTRLIHTSIIIQGNNNKVVIGRKCYLKDAEIYIEDSGGMISIGKDTSICGKTHLACIEGRKIEIGEGCLFSSDIVLRTGDSHSILNLDGKRINPSKDIKIGNHVWIGNRAILLKGSEIGDNSIVATGTVVTKKFEIKNIILGGNPSKIIKENITWDGFRIPVNE